MTILELIHEESTRFYLSQLAQVHQPDYLFLGTLEYDALAAIAKKFCVIPTTEPVSRFTYMGMAVFKVDAEHHISFGYAQPSPCG